MPHIPRSILQPGKLAPMGQSPVSPSSTRPTVPRQSKPKSRKNPLAEDKISIHKFEIPPDRIFKQLFGEEPKVDEHTGVTTNFAGPRRGLGG